MIDRPDGGLVFELCRQNEHRRKKLGQQLTPRLRNHTSRLTLIPVEQKTVEAFAFRISVRLACDRGAVGFDVIQFTHNIPVIAVCILHGYRVSGQPVLVTVGNKLRWIG